MRMSRYKHFDDELTAADVNEPAVLPELDVDEPPQLEFKPQLRNYASNSVSRSTKCHFSYFSSYLSKRTRLERCLLSLLCALLFLLLVTVSKLASHQEDKPVEQQLPCLTPACIQYASSVYAGLNQTVDPCEDFHEFVCGRWMKSNIIPKGHSSWSTTKELSRRNLIILKSILEQAVTNQPSTVFNAEQEAGQFYQSCMNTTEIERQAIKPLETFLQETLNVTLSQWINIDQNRTWQTLLLDLNTRLSSKYGFSYLLPVSIGPDDKNSTWNAIHVRQLR